jgi:UDPglucose 6-dehydrogenase
LARDVKTLSKLVDKKENLFAEIYRINALRNDWILRCMRSFIGELKDKKVVLLGVTYKPFTSTVRRSPALDIAELLKANGALCAALDPMADLTELNSKEREALPLELLTDAKAAFNKASAAVVVTEWPQFLELPMEELAKTMLTPLLIDTKNLFSKQQGLQGFTVKVPGKPPGKPNRS